MTIIRRVGMSAAELEALQALEASHAHFHESWDGGLSAREIASRTSSGMSSRQVAPAMRALVKHGLVSLSEGPAPEVQAESGRVVFCGQPVKLYALAGAGEQQLRAWRVKKPLVCPVAEVPVMQNGVGHQHMLVEARAAYEA